MTDVDEGQLRAEIDLLRGERDQVKSMREHTLATVRRLREALLAASDVLGAQHAETDHEPMPPALALVRRVLDETAHLSDP